MKSFFASFFVLAIVAPALAAEPTVTLTQSELRQLITAQVTAAIAQQAVQKANAEAAAVEKKITEAFAPPKEKH